MDYIETIKTFIIENFLFGDDFTLNNDASFLENGIIDSTGVLELVAFIEESFKVLIKDEELIPENFDSLEKINKFLHSKVL